MGGQLEDLAVIGTHPLEDGGGVVQRVVQDVNLRLAPRHEAAVHPDHAIPVFVGNLMHGHRPSTFSVPRSEEHTSELQSLMRISYAVFCLKKKKKKIPIIHNTLNKDTINYQYK